jgi:formate-dependent nitrite reductase membrane component NrfD
MRSELWDFMVKDTPSREWSEGMGRLIAVAFFCGGIAGGLYLTSLYFNNLWGMFIGWLFALAMGLADMAHLHNKSTAWRMVLRPNSSWISRGFLLVMLFIGAAAVQMALTFWAPGTVAETFFKIVAGIAAFGVATYSGFVLSYVNCVKIWNSTLMPILFVIAGLVGGGAILLAVQSFSGAADFYTVKIFTIAILAAYAVFVALHLWVSSYNGATALNSVKSIVKGHLSLTFWLVIILIGIVVPLIITTATDGASPVVWVINAVLILAGNLAFRLTILRAGMYRPLLPYN